MEKKKPDKFDDNGLVALIGEGYSWSWSFLVILSNKEEVLVVHSAKGSTSLDAMLAVHSSQKVFE